MFPAADVRRAVGALAVPDRDVRDFQAQFARTKQQVEIPKRIEVAEVSAIRDDLVVVVGANDLRAAERVLDRLTEQLGEDEAKRLVRAHVQELHRMLLHRINEPRTVREIGPVRGHRFIKLRQFFRRHRQVGIEDLFKAARSASTISLARACIRVFGAQPSADSAFA